MPGKAAKKQHDPIPALEWVAAAIGLLVALALIAIMAREGVMGRDPSVPLLSVTAEKAVSSGSVHVVAFEVRNASTQTAAAVQVEGKLSGGGEEETSSATIDYVPGQSSAKGGLLFKTDPRAGQLELRVTGYEIP